MAEVEIRRIMSFHPHRGHGSFLRALAMARIQATLPATLLIHGERGVGKQHLALWLGRLILCTAPKEGGPCGECRSCRMAAKLEHPDLHWYFPLPRPKNASSPDRLARALEEARMERLAEIRANPLYTGFGNEPRSLYLAAARSIRQRAQKKPSQGSHQVFVLAEAEALAPNDSSSEAANALLKLLEEPPPGTFLILTSNQPGRLLATIRSRTTQLHLPPIPRGEVAGFLEDIAGVESSEAARLAAISRGSIGRALGLMRAGGDPGAIEQTRMEALRLVGASLSVGPGPVYEASAGFPSFGSRGLQELLEFVEEWLRDLAMSAAGGGSMGAAGPEAAALEDSLRRLEISPASVARGMDRVGQAQALAAGNVNPQLVVFGLLQDLRTEWRKGRDTQPTRS